VILCLVSILTIFQNLDTLLLGWNFTVLPKIRETTCNMCSTMKSSYTVKVLCHCRDYTSLLNIGFTVKHYGIHKYHVGINVIHYRQHLLWHVGGIYFPPILICLKQSMTSNTKPGLCTPEANINYGLSFNGCPITITISCNAKHICFSEQHQHFLNLVRIKCCLTEWARNLVAARWLVGVANKSWVEQDILRVASSRGSAFAIR
jgi:hypothetical protein